MRIILFLVGFGLSIIGFMYIIAYLNYLSVGYSLLDYFYIIISKIECLLAPIGLTLLIISMFMRGDKYVLCIWFNIKL